MIFDLPGNNFKRRNHTEPSNSRPEVRLPDLEFVPVENVRRDIAGFLAVVTGQLAEESEQDGTGQKAVKSEAQEILERQIPPFFIDGPTRHLPLSHEDFPGTEGAAVLNIDIPEGEKCFVVPSRDSLVGWEFKMRDSRDRYRGCFALCWDEAPFFGPYDFSETESAVFRQYNEALYDKGLGRFIRETRAFLSMYLQCVMGGTPQMDPLMLEFKIAGPARRIGFNIQNPNPEAGEDRRWILFEIPRLNLTQGVIYEVTADFHVSSDDGMPALQISIMDNDRVTPTNYEFSFNRGDFETGIHKAGLLNKRNQPYRHGVDRDAYVELPAWAFRSAREEEDNLIIF